MSGEKFPENYPEDYFDDFQKEPSVENLKKALSLLRDEDVIIRITEKLKSRYPHASLTLCFPINYFKKREFHFFIEEEKEISFGEMRDITAEFEGSALLGFRDGVVIWSKKNLPKGHAEMIFEKRVPYSVKTQKEILSFLQETYEKYLVNLGVGKSSLAEARDMHGTFEPSSPKVKIAVQATQEDSLHIKPKSPYPVSPGN